VQTLYGHGCLPPSFRGRTAEDALGMFPSYPQGAISSEKDKPFVTSVRQAIPALRQLDAELAGLLDPLTFAPRSLLKAHHTENTRGSARMAAPAGLSEAVREPDRDRTPGGAGAASDGEQPQWFTVSDAARAAGINTGTISRAVDAGELRGNGKHGRE